MFGSEIFSVPLFPLNTVLFPQMPLTLHIFEERYRQMVRDLRESGDRFCVALIHEGEEVGGDAEPCTVACLADVVHLRPLPNGRYFMIAVGAERVRILSLDKSSKPYMIGRVERWPESSVEAGSPLVSRVSRLFMEYADYLMKLTGEPLGDFTLPEDADTLSYIVATALQISTPDRQELLEIPGTKARLQAEVVLLQSELPVLRLLANTPKPPDMGNGKFSVN